VGGTDYGLPRFDAATFTARLPFGMVGLSDAVIPLQMTITGWSPFIPGDADNSSLPVAALEYTFHNPTGAPVEGDPYAEGAPSPRGSLCLPLHLTPSESTTVILRSVGLARTPDEPAPGQGPGGCLCASKSPPP